MTYLRYYKRIPKQGRSQEKGIIERGFHFFQVYYVRMEVQTSIDAGKENQQQEQQQ